MRRRLITAILMCLLVYTGCGGSTGAVTDDKMRNVELDLQSVELEISGHPVTVLIAPASLVPIARTVADAVSRGIVTNHTSYDLAELVEFDTISVREAHDEGLSIRVLLPLTENEGEVLTFVVRGERVDLIRAMGYMVACGSEPNLSGSKD